MNLEQQKIAERDLRNEIACEGDENDALAMRRHCYNSFTPARRLKVEIEAERWGDGMEWDEMYLRSAVG